MQPTPMQVLTVRLPAAVVDAAQHAAEQHGTTVSEIARTALLTYLARDPATQRHLTVLYEIAKTRAVLLRLLDQQLGQQDTDQLLTLAEKDAQLYVQESQGGNDGAV